jgi:hypothetical protein
MGARPVSKTLWIYGDSFAYDWREEWCWTRMLPYRLGVERVVNQACAGASNEWSAMQFRDDKHAPGDIVVFFVTEKSRQWFYEDKPHMSNLGSIQDTHDAKDIAKLDPDKYSAVMNYWMHLQSDSIDSLRLEHMIDSIRVKQLEREIDLQIIPSFNLDMMWTDLVPCLGSMTWDVCDREFTSNQEMVKWYAQSIDTRANHMTRNNHSVFVDKLEHSLKTGEQLELDHGFETNFLTHRDKVTHPGLCAQLVDMARAPGNTIPRDCL